jgi:hypothetical protein
VKCSAPCDDATYGRIHSPMSQMVAYDDLAAHALTLRRILADVESDERLRLLAYLVAMATEVAEEEAIRMSREGVAFETRL